MAERHAQLNIEGGVSGSPALFLYATADTQGAAYAIQGVRMGMANDGPLTLNPSGGNVGIGTTSPAATLDVNGTLKSNSLSRDWDSSSSGYIRLGNVQICWGSFGAIGHTGTSAALYTGIGTLTTFPAPFKSGTVPTVTFMPDYANDGLYSISVEVGNNNTGFTPRVWASVSGTTGGSNQYIAIGLWQ